MDDRSGGSLDKVIAGCIDRLNAGEDLDPLEVITENPDRGEEILAELKAFVGLGSGSQADSTSEPGLGTLGNYKLLRERLRSSSPVPGTRSARSGS